MAKPKTELKVLRTFRVSLPAKHLVVKQMSDGSVECSGHGTEYTARMQANVLDSHAFTVTPEDFVMDGGSAAFERERTKKK